jgi:pyruvate formate lyase activating enzyme
MHEALFYIIEPKRRVRCLLCPHSCLIADGKAGLCRVRVNHQGKLITNVYGRLAAMHTDPIEKKPLYHFYPGRQILSVGTAGCNLQCKFCQNYHLMCSEIPDYTDNIKISPLSLVETAKNIPGNLGLAFTYNEPTVFYEMMLDTAGLAHSDGLKNVVVSNGYINSEPLKKLLKVTDAFNIDLKAFNNFFYHRITGGTLKPVLETLKCIYEAGKHLEITMLLIPSLNDNPEEFIQMVRWISGELSPEVPLHLSRYFPSYKMRLPPTPVETLEQLAKMASGELRFVFTGNVADSRYTSTMCYKCGSVLIDRKRYRAEVTGITKQLTCACCGEYTGLKYM